MTIKGNESSLMRDIWRIINEDSYAWICVWGAPRTGKSTLCLLLSYWVYKDWNAVLNSITFNLGGLLDKLIKGQPRKFPTNKGLNMRVPLIFVDDFGANCNKAITRYQRGWDQFKGSFDTLGTKVGVLLANMVKPNEATQQLTEKYTHEIWVHSRGKAKYDRISQQQDYKRWDSRQKKTWIAEISFPEVPDWVYKEYNAMRCALADEALYNIQETISASDLDWIMKRMQQPDKDLLTLIADNGSMHKNKLTKSMGNKKETTEALMRCKAKGLLIADRVGTRYYKYRLTGLGKDAVDAIESQT